MSGAIVDHTLETPGMVTSILGSTPYRGNAKIAATTLIIVVGAVTQVVK
jgi:hypothetical protein